ncbi:hypothetical protein DITRI_Ditri09bG0046300 [Diplodiscus trichospermus]
MADIPTQSQEPPRVVFVMIQLGGGGVGEDIKPGPAPVSKASIEAMARIKVKESGNDCVICLEEFKVGEEAREMPCKHVFHSGCVEKWLQILGSGPLCRFLMPAAEEAESGVGVSGGGLGSIEAMASLASLMTMAGSGRGSEQSGSGQVDVHDSSADTDCN